MKLSLFSRSYSKEEQQVFNFLSRNLLFSRLNEQEMSEFLPYLHLRKYSSNEAVFFRGDPSQALYIVKSGKVSISMDVGDNFEELAVMRPAEAFGEGAFFEDSRRIYNAVCVSHFNEIYVLPSVNLQAIFNDHKGIQAKILFALARSYHEQKSATFNSYMQSYGFFDLKQAFWGG